MDELITWMKGSALTIIIFYSIKGSLVLIIGAWLTKKAALQNTSRSFDKS